MESAHDPRVTPSLDMSNRYDRAAVRRVANQAGKRWAVTDEFKAELIQALRAATAIAMANGVSRDINDCVKTAAVLEGQNQADQHLDEKNARLDEGKPTESVATQYRVVFDGEANGA